MNTTQESTGVDLLAEWLAQPSKFSRPDPGLRRRHGTRFAFYGRTSTIGHQDSASSDGWQMEAAEAVIIGHGTIMAEFFDAGTGADSRSQPTARGVILCPSELTHNPAITHAADLQLP